MKITIELTDFEIKILEQDHEDVTAIVQDIVTGNIQQRKSRIAKQTALIYDEDLLLTELFNTPDYKNAAEKAATK